VALAVTYGGKRLLLVRGIETPDAEAMVYASRRQDGGICWGYGQVVDVLQGVSETQLFDLG
jgi:hypothetical protein